MATKPWLSGLKAAASASFLPHGQARGPSPDWSCQVPPAGDHCLRSVIGVDANDAIHSIDHDDSAVGLNPDSEMIDEFAATGDLRHRSGR